MLAASSNVLVVVSALLAATGGGKPSVIQIRADLLSPDAIGRSVLSALQLLESELNAGALLTTLNASRSGDHSFHIHVLINRD